MQSYATLVLLLVVALGAALLVARMRAARDAARTAAREAAQRESEARVATGRLHRAVGGIADYAIVVVDNDRRVASWNAGAERMTGYRADEIVGQPASLLYHPADVASGVVEHGFDEAARRGRYEAEGWRQRKDGTRFFAHVVVTAVRDPDGGAHGFINVARDITESRRVADALQTSEAKFRGVVDAAPDGIVIVGADGRIDLVNAEAGRLFGYTPDELVGQAIEILVPDRVRGAHVDHRTGYVAAPTTRPMGAGMDLVGRRRDGSEFPVEISLSPMATPGGMLIISVIRDVTERKRIERQIQTLNDALRARVAELNAVNQELEAFSYSVSHDLRAPLRGIDGFSQALLEDYDAKLDEQGRDYLGRIRAASQRMAELIDDLLDLSRVTRREMRRERVDLTALARTVAAQLERADPGRKVEWAIDEGVTALGDGALLRLVVENLLGNAWKFTSKQPVTRIEFRAVPHAGGTAYAVRDNGVGFDMAHAGKLFGAFQRLHAMPEFPGTGIGLAIVQRVVHRHGGRVWAEAAPGAGATFYFTV